jgi:hypothetical protein
VGTKYAKYATAIEQGNTLFLRPEVPLERKKLFGGRTGCHEEVKNVKKKKILCE